MKVALDISPLKSGHSVRGIGSYTKSLKSELERAKNIKMSFFADGQPPNDADIVHFPYFDIFFRSLKLPKNSKTVVTVHDVIPLVFPAHFPAGARGYINLLFQKKALQKCSAIICDSKTSKDDVVEKLSIDPKKVHVVYLAPANRFKQVNADSKYLKKKYDIPEDFLLYVGDVNWNKNIETLIDAVKLSGKNLVMVGKALLDNAIPETAKIEKQIARLKLENRVFRPGYVDDDDLVMFYNSATATILPSYYEGFGLPVLESMACGTPVICSKVASIEEIAGDNAIYCDPESASDIAGKIKEACALTKTQRESLSKKLIKDAAKFTWDKTAKETIRVYESI